MIPTILVCTMHCGEPDFEHCLTALRSQRDVSVKHHIVSFKPEMEAHNEVYQTFNAADPSWFRLKLDADVTLLHENVLSQLITFWKEHSYADWIDPPVYDSLTSLVIKAGIAFYTPKVRFSIQTNPLKCDRGIASNTSVVDYTQPVGHHMLYADERTAFHYGLHRGLKGQTHIEKAIHAAHVKEPLAARQAALKGFQASRSERYAGWHSGSDTRVPNDHGYNDQNFLRMFEESKVK